MNHIYHLIWNETTRAFVPVSEHTRSCGKSASSGNGIRGAGFTLKALVVSMMLAHGGNLYAAPTGGVVTAGSATINSESGNTTINQSSQNVALNWQSFNIGKTETVQFVQPNSNSVALNRVLGADPSSILGNLNANGKVFLVNPNGILFGKGASVNVGGLVASTRNISDSDFMAGNYSFTGNSDGSLLNQGSINADGGYVALLGANVSNEGIINARLGSVALVAGNAITLDFAGDGLLNVTVNEGAVNALVNNGGMIQADGGQVLMTAQAAGNLLHTVVNNTGIIQAQTIENHNGTIRLLGDMQSGTVNVSGTLDASAPTVGDGGFIDTSAAHVKVADDARVTTQAVEGLTGSWLIDPTDYTIAASGDITGAALSSNLGSTDITILSTSGGSGSAGNVNVNDTVTWSANKLTLNAQNNININTAMNGSGTASLAMEYGQGAVAAGNASTVNVNAPVNLAAGNNYSTKLGSDGGTVTYTVITSLGAAGSATATDLQGINGNLAGNYVLGNNIDASATSGWNSNTGFTPISTYASPFTGTFDGLGHTISNLVINLPGNNYVGLFGRVGAGGMVQNVGLIGGSVTAGHSSGALTGQNNGIVRNSYETGSVTGSSFAIGGLVGQNYGTISNSYATGAVTGSSYIGGLLGAEHIGGVLSNSYATGTVSASNYAGGLLGINDNGTVTSSYATGEVFSANSGGLIGMNNGAVTVNSSYWNTDISAIGIGSGTTVGATGLTSVQMQTASNFSGFNFTTTPGATGNNWVMVDVNGTLNNAGGATGATRPMLASEYSTTINNTHQLQLMAMGLTASYTLGQSINAAATSTTADVWGTAGFVPIGNYTEAAPADFTKTFNGTFDGQGYTISGLTTNQARLYVGFIGVAGTSAVVRNVGIVGGNLLNTMWGNGRLIGYNFGAVSNSYATGNVTGFQAVGGLVGANKGTIDNSYASATVHSTGTGETGGLVGWNFTTISNSYATGNVSSVNDQVGGLVGGSGGTISDSYATGNVSGINNVGGLVGNTGGTVTSSYASGEVTSTGSGAGGLAGNNNNQITDSYFTGTVTGTSNAGGLVGTGSGALSNSYYNIHAVAINGAVDTYVTSGGLYSGQYQDWFGNGLTLDIANYSATLSGGGNNYTVNSAQGLQDMLAFANNSAYTFTQTSNIDLTGQANLHIPYLAASFNGAGYTISNLSVAQSFSNAGLFGLITNTGTVSSVSLLNATVIGGNNAGGVAGRNEGTISNSHVSGAISGTSSIGGLAGRNQGTINNSSVLGAISGTNNIGGLVGFNNASVSNSDSSANVNGTNEIGGLVGLNYGTVTNSRTSGSVSGTGDNIGGLVGQNRNNISQSYAIGTVSGQNNVGGLVGGMNYGSLSNSYATGTVTGNNNVGGLVGNAYYSSVNNSYAIGSVTGNNYVGGLVGNAYYGSVDNSYSIGAVTGSSNVGGLMGNDFQSSSTNSYWDTTTSGQAGSFGGTGLTTSQMQTASNFTGFNFTTTPGATGNNWVMVDIDGTLNNSGGALGGTRPMLASEYSTTINNSHQLQLMQMNVAGSYVLGSNIDATATGTGADTWLSSGFIPLGNYTTQFIGIFDGMNYAINGLTINLPSGNTAGLFGNTMSGAIISNVGLTNVNIHGYGGVGALVGQHDGTAVVNNSYSTGSVNGVYRVGGLVGGSYGTITNSYSSATVTGSSGAGGLVGRNYIAYGGSFSNNYATGNVSGGSDLGGLIGANDNASAVSNSYSTGSVIGTGVSGGLIGSNNGSVTSSFWDITTSGQATSAGGIGMTTADMQTQANFTSATAANGNVNPGWDLASLWVMYEGHTSPLLRSFLTSITVTASDIVKTYDGLASVGSGITYSTTPDGNLLGALDYGNAKNVGVYSASGLYSNQQGYLITYVNGSLTVNQANLTLSTSNVSKTYDGGLSAVGTATVTGGSLFGSDSINGGSFAFTDKNVGSGNKTVTTSGITVSDGNSGGNYNISYVDNTTSTISQANLTLSTSNISKTYDGGLSAAGIATITSGSLFGSDLISGGSFAFTDKNVGSGNKIVTASGVTVSDGNSGGNYSVSYADNTTSSITPYAISLSGTRAYDGTTDMDSANLTSGTLVGTETLVLSGTGTVANKNVGNGKTVTLGSLALGNGTNGGLASNYTFTGGSQLANITQANLTLSTSNISKIYDGGLSAIGTATVTGGSLFGSDSINGGSFAFTNKNVGSGNKTVSTSGVTVSDGNSGGNYSVSYADNTTSSITPYAISLSGTRAYDGTTNMDSANLTLGTLVGTETLVLSGTGTVASKNVGNGKTVTLGSLALGNGTNGGLASNYTFTGGSQLADITQANLTLSTSNVSKIYDGGLSAIGTATVTGGSLFGSDTINGGSFAFTDKNVGSGNKTVTTSGVTVSDGNSGGNYSVSYVDNTTSTISQANLTLSTGNVSKTYDGGLSAIGTATVTSGSLFGSDSISGGSFAFTDKNVGSGNKSVTTSGVTVSDGNSGSNYSVSYADNNTSTISQANLTLSTGNVSKTYDGGLNAIGTAMVTSGSLFGSDSINGGSFSFTDKNVGSTKTVTTSGATVSDGNSGNNYNVSYADNTTSTISQANLTLSTGNVSKTYDGGLSAIGTATVTGGSLFGSDSISGGSFAFTDKNVGSGNKTVATSGVTVSDGNSGGNYSVSYADNITSTILSKALAVSGQSALSKVYDGNTTATLTGGMLTGVISGEAVTLTEAGSFATSNVGSAIAVTATNSISGADASNYSVIQPLDLSADITVATIPTNPTIPTIPTVDVINPQLNDAIAYVTIMASPAQDNLQGSQLSANPNTGYAVNTQYMPDGLLGLNLSIKNNGIRLPFDSNGSDKDE